MRLRMQRHGLAIYFALAFALTWLTVLAIVLPVGIPRRGEAPGTTYLWVFAAMAASPPFAGLVVTAALEGRPGLRQVAALFRNWRADPGAWATALLLVPAITLAVLVPLSLAFPAFTPGVFTAGGGWPLLLVGLGSGLVAGGLEEIGWTGYVLRRLDLRAPVATGIALGAVHGLWHLPAGYWGEGAVFGLLYIPYFITAWLIGLSGLRLLIVWLFSQTRSLPLAQLAHASYTASLLILWPPAASPQQTLVWTTIFALVLLAVTRSLVAAMHRSA